MEVDSGVIELPGEANPLTENFLVHVLSGAASNDPQKIQISTKQLQTWETQKHFFVHLQSAFLDRRLPLEVRYLAVIQLKNGVDKYWRKTANNAISADDKDNVRSRLLESGINEGDQRLALQNALVVAKIVRFDWPNSWPDVIPQLMDVLRSSAQKSNPLHLSRALLILKHVVKELSTGRLRSTKASLFAAAPELLNVVGTIYLESMQRAMMELTSGDVEETFVQQALEQALLAMKVVRRLAVAGYEFPNRATEIQQLNDLASNYFEQGFQITYDAPVTVQEITRNLLHKNMLQIAKFHVEMSQMHPVAFTLLNGPSLVQFYWNLVSHFGETYGSKSADFSNLDYDGVPGEDEGQSALENVCIKGLLIIRASLKLLFSPVQTLRFSKDEKREDEKKQAIEMLNGIFTDDFIRTMMDQIVRRYFVLRQRELAEWEDEAEEWERREEGEGEDVDTSIRICAERVFLDISINYKRLIVQPLVAVFQSIATPQNEDVLFKDSIYTAIGLAAPVVYEHIDFDAFIQNCLSVEVTNQQPAFKILRRRIAILLGQWISIKVSADVRPAVYEIFKLLLTKDDSVNDQVVRITAGKQFKNIADAWEFEAAVFVPFAPDILSQLMSLIQEVELSETKLALLNTVSVLAERMEHHITPYADRIISLLPSLWDQSGSEHLMKQAILAILARLFISMKATGVQYHGLALPIIKRAVQPGAEEAVYLLDDALDLWHSVLKETPTPVSPSDLNPDLISMLEYIIPTLELGSEALRKALEITESYLLLAPQVVISSPFIDQLLMALASLLGNLKPDASGFVTDVVEEMVNQSHILGGEEGVQELTSTLLGPSEFFARIVRGLKTSWEAHQTTGPKAVHTMIQGMVETDYFSLLARIAYVSPETLVHAILAISEDGPQPVASISSQVDMDLDRGMKWLLDEWFSHTEDVSDPGRRKLMAMALTRLLDLHQSFILVRLQNLMSMWTDVITELTDANEERGVDSLVYNVSGGNGPASFEHTELKSPEEDRKQAIFEHDPIHKVNLLQLVRETFMTCIQQCGGEENFRCDWLVNVDKEVVTAFVALGIL